MDLSIILALFILSLLQASTRPQQQQQQQNVVEQAPTATATSNPPNPAQNQPLAELQNSLNKFLYQLQQTGEKVVAQPPPHPPLLFPAAMRHSGAAGGGGAGGDALGSASPAVRPLAPLGHPPLFPSSLLVPTPAHLPPTFRLPATVMEQHKAFPMDGSPTHPVVVFPVILEQSSKRHRIGIGTENNGTTETPTTITSISSPSQTLDTALNEQNTVSDATTVSELEITVHDDHATVAADANAIRQRVAAAAAPLAVPLKMLPNETTPNEATVTVTTSSPPPTLETTVTTPTPTEPVLANDYDGQKQHIFFVPGGAKQMEANETRQGLTAVDLEAFLRSANITRMLSTWQQNNNNNNTLSSQDTKLFLALVERVLEQELARRLEHDNTHQQRQQQQQQNNDANSNSTQRLPQVKRPNIAVRTDGHQIVLELPKNEADQDVQTVQHQGNNDELEQDLEERLLDSQKQLKTANTRLFSLASNEEAALVPGHRDGAVAGGQPHQKGVISLRRGNTASTSSSAASATTIKKPSIVRETDYKQREQAEFDRLLDRLRAEEGVADPPDPGNNKSGGGGGKAAEDTDLLLIVPPRSPDVAHAKLSGGRHGAIGDNNANTAPTSNSATTVAPITTPQSVVTTAVASSTATTPVTVQQQQQPKQAIDNNNNSSSSGDDGHAGGMMLNRQHQFWLRHGPKTKFERLVEDYRWRLAGQDSQNGLNDLIKALRNSNIGFFDRLSSPTSLKILRRVD